MTDPLDAIAIVAEVVSWLLLPSGLLLLIIGLSRRAWSSKYRSAKAVITNVTEYDAKLRWFGDGGDVHETVSDLTGPIPAVGDARTVWVHPSRPESARLDSPTHDGRALITLGGILTAVGAIAVAVSFLLPLLG